METLTKSASRCEPLEKFRFGCVDDCDWLAPWLHWPLFTLCTNSQTNASANEASQSTTASDTPPPMAPSCPAGGSCWGDRAHAKGQQVALGTPITSCIAGDMFWALMSASAGWESSVRIKNRKTKENKHFLMSNFVFLSIRLQIGK